MRFGRIVLFVIGLGLLFFGIRWILQGANILTSGGQAMVGHSEWVPIGSVTGLVGLACVVLAFLWKRMAKKSRE